ncbi:MAG TPA: C40 family peptidase [Gaiellaceae bacterium]|nr:C40 family peptidase [Gaiellaceae bacterium]
MTAQIRLILLVLVLVYSVVFGSGQSLGAAKKRGPTAHRVKGPRPRANRRGGTTVAAVTVGDRAVLFARKLLGTPYRWGGDSPITGFDCSGFVRFVYARFGVRLPHSSYADFGLGRSVARSSLQPGDLVFFNGVGHVGMYIGDGRFIHAPHTGTDVQVTSLSEPWYRASYDGARRLVATPVRKLAVRARTTPKRGDQWFGALFEQTNRAEAAFRRPD